LIKSITNKIVKEKLKAQSLDHSPVHAVESCEFVTSEVVVKSFFGQNFDDCFVNGKPIAFELAR
jgi:hypothetical protein